MANSNKKKLNKKRKVARSKINTSSDQKENRPKGKKITLDLRDGIAMSKQLLLKKTKNLQNRRLMSRDETRICGNGIPLPPLAELEKMYEDSDEEINSMSTPQENSTITESPQTPELEVNENKHLSPTTIHKISERLMNIISDISAPHEFLNQDVPPPSIVPPKKRKKPEEPYIVGCKERPLVPNTLSTNFCKGDAEYGVDASSVQPDSPPRKRAKKSKIPSYSKSIFNAKSDEIAEKLLKNNGNTEETDYESSDSNKTVEYVPRKILSPKLPSFSPLPSTSRDCETFIRNDELFNQSLRDDTHEDETTTPQTTSKDTVNNIIISTVIIDDDEDDVVIIQPTPTGINPEPCLSHVINSTETNIHNDVNDHDAYIGITEPNDGSIEDIIEIDVDDVIAQNQAILGKLKRNNGLNANIITAQSDFNGNHIFNNTVNKPVKATTNMNQSIAQPNPKSMPQTPLLSGVNSGLNPSEGAVGGPPSLPQEIYTLDTPMQIYREMMRMMPEKPKFKCFNSGMERSGVVEPYLFLNATGETMDSITQIQSSLPSISKHLSRRTIKRTVANFFKRKNKAATSGFRKKEIRIESSRKEIRIANMQNMIKDFLENFAVQCASKIKFNSQEKKQNSDTENDKSLDPPRNIGECPICMEQLSAADGIASTICGHVFCLKCIQVSIEANGRKCPTCRKGLRVANGYHQIYL